MKIKLIEENNDTIEKFKAVSNELLSDYSIVANIEIIKNYKDNPVPSLDDFVELCRQMIYLAGNNPKQKSYAIKTINKEFYKLQNGVETNKEQPYKFDQQIEDLKRISNLIDTFSYNFQRNNKTDHIIKNFIDELKSYIFDKYVTEKGSICECVIGSPTHYTILCGGCPNY